MKIYAFDVDETLEFSGGPVTLVDLLKLREAGHCVGLCGNFAVVTLQMSEWWRVCSFIGPMMMLKDQFLLQIKMYVRAEDYVMVGNILGVTGASDDQGAAQRAGWRFISERDFARGAR